MAASPAKPETIKQAEPGIDVGITGCAGTEVTV
jgi:hypothetical protein